MLHSIKLKNAYFTIAVIGLLSAFLQTRVNSLTLWLRLWNAETGEFVWEGAAEATVASTLLEEKSSLALHDIARRLWTLMLRETLIGGKTKTAMFSQEQIFARE